MTAHTHPSRRDFLGSSLAAGVGLPFAGRLGDSKSRRAGPGTMLILGGTRFLGPQVVRAARESGYTVTLFNRGQSNPELFLDLEQLRGDRDTGDLDALQGREWDIVVDTSGYVPAHVHRSAELLAGHVGHYVFVSTISVYADTSAAVVGEDTPVATIDAETEASVETIRQARRHYGALKARCEQAAQAALPGRVALLRPGLIVGPEDSSDRFTYWPFRVERGGEVLAPGDPDREVQFIDVRDLGEWCVHVGRAKHAGTYNAVGFAGRLSFQELLHGCKVVSGADCSFTWVSEEFLLANEVRPYREMPLWLPNGVRGHIDNRRAIDKGLRFRTVADTIAATLAWHQAERPDHEWQGAGMREDREKALLAAWRPAAARASDAGKGSGV